MTENNIKYQTNKINLKYQTFYVQMTIPWLSLSGGHISNPGSGDIEATL